MGDGHDMFSDPAVERDFRLTERRSRIPTVRVYGLLTLGLLLAYALVNPIFFSDENVVRFTFLVVASLVVLGCYVLLTFWDRYAEHPAVDFACLLALGLLILAANVVLWREAARVDGVRYANVAISNAAVCAFAAIVMAERTRRFATWLACHALGFSMVLLFLEATPAGRTYASLSYLTVAAIAAFINWALGRAHRTAYALRAALEAERAKTAELLYNVLPEAAARRLREGQIVADAYSDASVVFADVVGFSRLAATVSPGHLIELLNAFFNLADRCAAEHGVEKVKTIGDAYLAVSGGNVPAANSADAALAFAKAVIAGLDEVREATGLPLEVRIGIHSGPVVGGVIGATRMAYDYWGETMNMASRIEGQAAPNGNAVPESPYLRPRLKALFDPPVPVQLKGVGETRIYRAAAERP
jgi:class 3 adenylate cyclase